MPSMRREMQINLIKYSQHFYASRYPKLLKEAIEKDDTYIIETKCFMNFFSSNLIVLYFCQYLQSLCLQFFFDVIQQATIYKDQRGSTQVSNNIQPFLQNKIKTSPKSNYSNTLH